jgi:23S rRNA (cytosine1962-C5)-methyltransferase
MLRQGRPQGKPRYDHTPSPSVAASPHSRLASTPPPGYASGVQHEAPPSDPAPAPTNPAPDSKPPTVGQRRSPWVQLRTFSYHPTLFPAMIRETSPNARAGSLVTVYDKEGRPFGTGLYHPKARIPLRMFHHGPDPFDESGFERLLDRAVALRLQQLRLAEVTDAFRVVHSDGDGLSGLVVDRYADALSVTVHSLGVFQRLDGWLARLHAALHTRLTVIEVDPEVARKEGIPLRKIRSDPVRSVKVREHGIRYEVDFDAGHKTGFFCDQRENRRRLASWTRGLRVLDLCCYTGGFALSARTRGEAAEVTGVDLDERAIAQARRNANLNQARIEWVHCDAFSYARQMHQNNRRWDVVVLDPPKLVLNRDEEAVGRRKYEDLNQLAVGLLEPGGLLVTCSCSGLVSEADFERMVIRGAHRAGRRLQVVDRTGAGADHPVMSNCPESRYLKVLWTRVW